MPLHIQRRAMKRIPHLMRTYQPPVSSRKSLIASQAEDSKRRKTSGIEVVAGLPFVPQAQKSAPFEPRDTPDLNDRFHKQSDTYSTIANPHFITTDPVRLPGRYEFIQEAIDDIATNIVPKYGPDFRHAVIVHGGNYTEDVTISSPQIDLYGLGRPRINGTLTSDMLVNSYLVEGFELYGGDTYAVDLPAFMPPASGEVYGPMFNRCYVHSQGAAFRTLGRVVADKCRFAVDYLDDDYTNLDAAAIEVYHGTVHTMWSEFHRCRIEGAPDRRTPLGAAGFPNKGRAWYITSKSGPIIMGYNNWMPGNTGVMFRKCTIVGYGYNEVWRVYHDHCMAYGGKKHATAGEVYSFVTGYGSEGLNIEGHSYFDHTGVACRYLVQEGDMGPGFTRTTATWLQHFKQLCNDGDWHGSMIVPSPTVFAGFGNAPLAFGGVYGEHSVSWRQFFLANGVPAEIALLLNCDSELGHYANNLFAFGAGILGGFIVPNPYQL